MLLVQTLTLLLFGRPMAARCTRVHQRTRTGRRIDARAAGAAAWPRCGGGCRGGGFGSQPCAPRRSRRWAGCDDRDRDAEGIAARAATVPLEPPHATSGPRTLEARFAPHGFASHRSGAVPAVARGTSRMPVGRPRHAARRRATLVACSSAASLTQSRHVSADARSSIRARLAGVSTGRCRAVRAERRDLARAHRRTGGARPRPHVEGASDAPGVLRRVQSSRAAA